MVDNSISMADKQRLLAEAVPVLVQRLVDPLCADEEGNPTLGTTSAGCAPYRSEFSPIRDIHIGIITSSLGNHGGDVCTSDPNEMPPRTLNDAAQLVASVRPSAAPLYSYQNHGFLVWDPRTGADIPVLDPHPNKSNHETVADTFAADFAAHVAAAGERGCGYESSLEAWYRFLIDPEPINQVTNDGYFSVRGPVNQVLLDQRRNFLRPDSLLAIVMLTDENDCSINDENGQQGWLVGSLMRMPRGSDACSRPDDPNIYRCCIPCVLLDAPGYLPMDGCSYGGDISCNHPDGRSLTALEDSTNLRCYDQVRRLGVNLLYSWQRYSDALTQPRIRRRPPESTEITNPIYTPGNDGTPARERDLVFLTGIVGVPWQDIATEESLTGRGLSYLTAPELGAPLFGPNRWDVMLGDPDTGRLPTDPFMIESIGAVGGTPVAGEDQRASANPIVPNEAVTPPGGARNNINGTEQNVVNRDDLQYACIFDLVPDVPCDGTNQDGCDCNASEQAYERPICQYSGSGQDGTQTHAKAYPGVRHLQVLKAFGDNAIVASICPKNVVPQGGPTSDPDYGYNPAVAAMVGRFREVLGPRCLPRSLETPGLAQIACSVVEARLGTSCSCSDPGRTELPRLDATFGIVQDALMQAGLCGGATGVACSDYCMCEIEQLSGAELSACQSSLQDPTGVYGFCYVDPENGIGVPEIVAACPSTQRRVIRFLGVEAPAPDAATFVVCAAP
jgi:hypothetical protein